MKHSKDHEWKLQGLNLPSKQELSLLLEFHGFKGSDLTLMMAKRMHVSERHLQKITLHTGTFW